MKYIIMCGGNYSWWKTQKHLIELNGEPLVARTIRLLRENGINDIAISTNKPELFERFGVEVIDTQKSFTLAEGKGYSGRWLSGFVPTEELVCYLFGDVIFSPNAIKTIINTPTNDIEFFASAPPFGLGYRKPYAEPFGFKVSNQKHFRESIEKALAWNGWRREPVSWELWQVIKGTKCNHIDYTNYTAINDYTCDIDHPSEIDKLGDLLDILRTEKELPKYLIHAVPKRMWYVKEYLIPSMIKQGIAEENIRIYNDENHDGNLVSCLKSFLTCEGDGGTWHLQDDILISKDFKEKTEKYNTGLICGFSSAMYDGANKGIGCVPIRDMWFSFPCIRIPNSYARECAKWVNDYIIGNPVYYDYWKNGVNDDWAFRTYLREFHSDEKGFNLAPNIVEHIDYLIGGGTGKKKRDVPCRSQYFNDLDLVEELKDALDYNKER